ncbi:MAG TPA: DNA recombination protein RmuC [Firmicutes bacterium]|nr:DNA recombination protein RmuC [Bacillota bacterium]
MTAILAAAFSAVAVVLCVIVLLRLPKRNDGVTYDQLRREMADQSNDLMRQLSLLKQELDTSMTNTSQLTGLNIEQMTRVVDRRLLAMQDGVEKSIRALQEDNARKLDGMRQTVDEKLTATLEKRLGESFSAVSEQLKRVYEGLGEMQALAAGVGDLKKVLTNVKTRGTWGEIALGSLLEQLLSPQQYRANVRVIPRRNEIVEYAICLPGREEGDETVYLPIDSKFPMESYLRLVDASEAGDPAGVDAASRQLEAAVRECARTIRDKYIAPPHTTDFAILFLPTEGLYAEVTRRAALCAALQRDCRVTIMGPATLGAFLNSLQMGFRTLAIQKRSGEVWKLLGAVKTEFGRFGEALSATQKKLEEATANIGRAARRTEIIRNRLRSVEELPEDESAGLIGEDPGRADGPPAGEAAAPAAGEPRI